jgi:histidinol-phosphate aminotransferase
MTMPDIEHLIRPHLRKTPTYSGVDPSDELARQAGIRPEDVIRLNANENPFGAPAAIQAAVRDLPLHLYPDPAQRKLRAALSEYTGQPVARLMAGAGGDEIIDLLMRLLIEPGDRVIECDPTFGMYSFCARLSAAELVSVPRGANWEVDVAAVRRAVTPRTKILFIASPNNPTGNSLSEQEARALLDLGILVAIDETYYEFCGKTLAHLTAEYPNLVVVRSFSKWAGIAGLRVGYMIGSEGIVARLMDIKQPYNINVAAEAAAMAALRESQALLKGARTLIEQRERFEAAIKGLDGILCFPSDGNFVLCRFTRKTARQAYEGLARQGIFVRYFSHARLQDSLRISAGTPGQTDRLIAAVRNVV